ncbi:hypothetical protein Scep_002009 [Stephania cephalantha]|uniref:Uncharacterized protein n=1 Tax=Stephania cephalantha TaxID=152367 RepID=A0AAP0LAG6_9MAGN
MPTPSSHRYASSPALLAVELLNEPWAQGVSLDGLSKYYKLGYDAVRRHTSTAYVVMSNKLFTHDPDVLPYILDVYVVKSPFENKDDQNIFGSNLSSYVLKIIHERDWYYLSFLGPHTTKNRVKVKANSKPSRLELPPLPTHGAHQAPSTASRCSLVASKVEEMKKVKEGSSLVVQQLSVIALHYCELLHFKAKLQMRRRELTQTTPDQPVDDEAVYYKVASECPKRRVYGLGSLGRKKGKYADTGANTSQVPPMVPHSEFDNVVEQLRQVVEFMQMQFGMTMDGADLSQPPPPQEQQQAQTDPADPPQQHDNVDREMQDWLTGDEKLGDT